MKTTIWILFIIFLIMGPASTIAATFTATAEGNTITIYSASKKEGVCEVRVPFSYWHKGKREYTSTRCPNRPILISDRHVVCSVTHKEIVNPKIEGPVESMCD